MHNEKLAFTGNDPSSVEETADKDAAAEHGDQEPDNCVGRLPVPNQLKASAPETLPSDLSPSVFSQITKSKNRLSGSIVSRGWTVQDGQGDDGYYSPMPAMANNKKYRSCNLCSDPLEVSSLTQEAWEYVMTLYLGIT